MLTLITVSWNNNPSNVATNSPLIRSWSHFNPKCPVIHQHYYRPDYSKDEKRYGDLFGAQGEYLLYKISLMRDLLKLVDTEFVVFGDYNDTFCIGEISPSLTESFDLDSCVVFSSERNMWPKPVLQHHSYKPFYQHNQYYLNSGVVLAKTDRYKSLLDSVHKNWIDAERQIMGGDQGAYVSHFNTTNDPPILLDHTAKFSLSTYDSDPNDYYLKNNRLLCKKTHNQPVLIHDNGTGYGGQKFMERFQLPQF